MKIVIWLFFVILPAIVLVVLTLMDMREMRRTEQMKASSRIILTCNERVIENGEVVTYVHHLTSKDLRRGG